MTDRIRSRSSQGRTLLAALGVAGLALFAAAPANAIYRSYEPAESESPTFERTVAKDDTSTPKKGCSVTLSTGQGIVYDHGYSFSVKNKATGQTHTYTCNDGKWEETVSAPSPSDSYTWEADNAYVDGSGTAFVQNPRHYENTYSSDSGYVSAQP